MLSICSCAIMQVLVDYLSYAYKYMCIYVYTYIYFAYFNHILLSYVPSILTYSLWKP